MNPLRGCDRSISRLPLKDRVDGEDGFNKRCVQWELELCGTTLTTLAMSALGLIDADAAWIGTR